MDQPRKYYPPKPRKYTKSTSKQLVGQPITPTAKRHRPKTRFEETREWERDGFKRVKVLPDGWHQAPTNERVSHLPQDVVDTPTRAELVAKYGPPKGRILLPSPNVLMKHVEAEIFWDEEDPIEPNADAARRGRVDWIVGWRAPTASGDKRISETVRTAMANTGARLQGLVIAPGPWRGHKFQMVISHPAHRFDPRRAHSGESHVALLEILEEMVEDIRPYMERRSLKRAIPKTHGLATATTI